MSKRYRLANRFILLSYNNHELEVAHDIVVFLVRSLVAKYDILELSIWSNDKDCLEIMINCTKPIKTCRLDYFDVGFARPTITRFLSHSKYIEYQNDCIRKW